MVGLNKVIIVLVLCNMVGSLEQLSDCQLMKKSCAAERRFTVLHCSETDRQTVAAEVQTLDFNFPQHFILLPKSWPTSFPFPIIIRQTASPSVSNSQDAAAVLSVTCKLSDRRFLILKRDRKKRLENNNETFIQQLFVLAEETNLRKRSGCVYRVLERREVQSWYTGCVLCLLH